jgi:hypothetical protein
MSVWSKLGGQDGELISLRIAVEPRLLEDLLETLAGLPFPVNPQLKQRLGDAAASVVEFPAYESQLEAVRQALSGDNFPDAELDVRSMMEEIKR